MGTFLIAVIAIGYGLSWYNNNPALLYIAIALSLGTNIFAYWNSDKVAIASAGAQATTRPEYPELYRVVENLAITAGLPMPRIYVINDPAPNAFATGRDKEHAALAVTTGLLSMMSKTELEGVIAHELSHIGNRDILIMTVAVVLVGFIAALSDVFMRMSFFGGRDSENKSPLAVVGVVVALIIAPIAAQLMQLAISRRREFLADTSGALLTRYPEGLASALQKISLYEAPMERASSATAHLFISNPFGSHPAGRFVARLFSTHPPLEERINILREMH
jgi:heat shock protein HtpX